MGKCCIKVKRCKKKRCCKSSSSSSSSSSCSSSSSSSSCSSSSSSSSKCCPPPCTNGNANAYGTVTGTVTDGVFAASVLNGTISTAVLNNSTYFVGAIIFNNGGGNGHCGCKKSSCRTCCQTVTVTGTNVLGTVYVVDYVVVPNGLSYYTNAVQVSTGASFTYTIRGTQAIAWLPTLTSNGTASFQYQYRAGNLCC
jgi:hypothetical protein